MQEEVSTTGEEDPRLGTCVAGRYHLDRFLARGGMGAVYAATDQSTGAAVALKVLEDHTDGAIGRRRFFNEAAMCQSVAHERVVKVHDFGADTDAARSCFMVMELLEGVTLHRYLGRKKVLPVDTALQVAVQLCDGLAAAHARSFVHRDLKPSNVFVTGEREGVPEIKLLDFGLAKRTTHHVDLTLTGTFLGSPTYMSPEQVKGLAVGPGTDIYNVGLVLWRMLTGHPAFRKAEVSATLLAHVTEPVPSVREAYPDLAIPAEVEWVLSTCLAKRPEDRFGTVEELAAALDGVRRRLAGESSAEIPFHGRTLRGPIPTARISADPPAGRRVGVMVLGAMALGLMLLFAGATMLVVIGFLLGRS